MTGCGCSGTQAVAESLSQIGLITGHEAVYSPTVLMARLGVRWREYQGDASWLAEPFAFDLLDARVPVIRLVRNPLHVAQSAFADGFLTARRRERLGVSARFAFERQPELAEVSGSPLDLAVRWATGWDHRTANDDRVLTVRVEDGGAALRAILEHVGRSQLADRARCDEVAAAAAGRNTHRATSHSRPGWAEMLATRDGDKLAARALLLGYEVQPFELNDLPP